MDIDEELMNDRDMGITLEEYFNDGKLFNMALYQLKFVKEGLRQIYLKMENKFGKFKYNVAKTDNGFLYHIIIPSESITKLFYDVIIELDDINNVGDNLMKYGIKFFCNSPSFTFTYAYAMNENGIFSNIFEDKLPKIFLEKPPIEKNPNLVIGYEKFTYIAIEFLKDMMLFKKSNAEKAVNAKVEDIKRIVCDADTKLKEIKMKKSAMSEKDKFIRRKNKSRDLSSRVNSNSNMKINKKNKQTKKLMNKTKNVLKPKPKIKGKRKIGR